MASLATAATSANAIHVLRLVLSGRASAARSFSTAALALPARSHSAFASAHSTTTAPSPVVDFLEREDTEYEGAAAFLPSRPSTHPDPIPWPTLFSHAEAPPPAVQRQRPCDLLARYAADGSLDEARKVFDELCELHVNVLPRQVYLSAAAASLAPTEQGRANFLFWLELIPNRPAMKNNPTLKATWAPVLNQLLAEHLDPAFLSKFLLIAGRKGLLPTVFPPLMAALALTAPPDVTEGLVDGAITAYVKSTTSSSSTSDRAEEFRKLVAQQTRDWWNLYLRSLALAGWEESAYALLISPPEGIRWTRFTRAVVLGEDLERRDRAVTKRAEATAKNAAADPLLQILETPTPDEASLAHRMQSALDPDALPSVAKLARIQRELLARSGEERLLARFRQRFCHPPTTHGRNAPTVNEMWWWHASIIRHAENKEHEEAVRTFRKRFLWIGLPKTNVGTLPETTSASKRALRLPTIKVITSVLPSILTLLPPPDAVAYHAAYLATVNQLPRSLAPTPFTHLAFVRNIAHRLGPASASRLVTDTVALGLDPGEPAWNALLLSFTGRGQTETASEILQAMELNTPLSKATNPLRMPRPSAKTYSGLVRLCMTHGRRNEARFFLARFKTFLEQSESSTGHQPTAVERDQFAHAEEVVTKIAKSNSSKKGSMKEQRKSTKEVEHTVEETIRATG